MFTKEHFKKERAVEIVDLVDSKNATKMIIERYTKVAQHSDHCFLAICSLANSPRSMSLSFAKNLMPGEGLMKLKMVHTHFSHLWRRIMSLID